MNSNVSHARAGWEVLEALKTPGTSTPPAPAPEVRRTGGKRAAARVANPAVRPTPDAAPAPVEAPVAAAMPVPAPVVEPAAEPVAPRRSIEALRPEVPDAARPWAVEFNFRRKPVGKTLAGLLLLAVTPVTVAAAWVAYEQRDVTLAGISLILAVLALGLWFLRVLSTPATVSLKGPDLTVHQAGREMHWNLASQYSPIDHVRGRAGRPGWRVVLRNPDGGFFTIDSSMVNPRQFMDALRLYQPTL